MNTPARISLLVITASITACATTPTAQPPTVKLDVPAEFGRSLVVNHFRTGEDVLHIDWNPTGAQAPMTQYAGKWPAQLKSADENHRWTIDVYSGGNPKVSAAYARAKNGYEADLDEFVDFLLPPSPPPPGYSPPQHALAYFFGRFERKHFHWGNAVSFLSQGTQDTSIHTPENGHLWYEVWGVTKDRRHTVIARAEVGHPKLETGGEDVRGVAERDPAFKRRSDDAWKRNDVPLINKLRQEAAAREEAELRNHPHTKLIESCNPDEFEPSLTVFDRIVDSLILR